MKKIFITLAFVFMLSCSAYADGEPAYILFGNVINITGGSNALHIQTDDYSPEDRTAASSITVLDSIWSSQPVMFNSIPSERNALMNSGEPVDIIVRGDKLSITSWGGEGVYSMRILDSNGSTIIKDTLRTRTNSGIEISLTPEYRHYYIEFTESEVNYDYDSENGYFPSVNDSSEREIRYCYILLRMKSSNSESEIKSELKAEPEKIESNSAADAIGDIYRQLRNRKVNDTVIHLDDTKNEPLKPDEAIRPREPEPEPEDDDDTNLIPARRIKIKRNTEYESELESESEPE